MMNVIWGDRARHVAGIVDSLRAHARLDHELTLDDSLVDNGFSSIGMVDLMLAVECAFDVTIPQRELVPANFVSIRTLVDMLGRLCPAEHDVLTA